MFNFDKIVQSLGGAALELRNLDAETKRLLLKLLIRGSQSGDLNGYIKERLNWIFQAEDSPERPAKWMR